MRFYFPNSQLLDTSTKSVKRLLLKPTLKIASMKSRRAVTRCIQRGLALALALFVVAYLTRGLIMRESYNESVSFTSKPSKTPEMLAEEMRCNRVRQRVATSLANYVQLVAPYDENLKELLKPMFPEKHLVVWSTQANAGPLLDLRSLLEPLGVDFIEHTVQHNCRQLCDCNAPSQAIEAATAALVRPNNHFRRNKATAFRTALANLSSFSRIDAFFSAYPYENQFLYFRIRFTLSYNFVLLMRMM